MKITISKKNLKLGGIPSFSFPPVVTCTNCAACVKKCYAAKLARIRPSVGATWAENLKAWKESPQAVDAAITAEAFPVGYFRYFVGGDIPDADFLALMVRVARRVKSCKFLAFTKKYSLVNDYLNAGGKLPKNLKILFSEWGDEMRAPNPHNLPTTDVIFKGQQIPERANVCGGECINCMMRGVGCWNLKKGEKIYFKEH